MSDFPPINPNNNTPAQDIQGTPGDTLNVQKGDPTKDFPNSGRKSDVSSTEIENRAAKQLSTALQNKDNNNPVALDPTQSTEVSTLASTDTQTETGINSVNQNPSEIQNFPEIENTSKPIETDQSADLTGLSDVGVIKEVKFGNQVAYQVRFKKGTPDNPYAGRTIFRDEEKAKEFIEKYNKLPPHDDEKLLTELINVCSSVGSERDIIYWGMNAISTCIPHLTGILEGNEKGFNETKEKDRSIKFQTVLDCQVPDEIKIITVEMLGKIYPLAAKLKYVTNLKDPSCRENIEKSIKDLDFWKKNTFQRIKEWFLWLFGVKSFKETREQERDQLKETILKYLPGSEEDEHVKIIDKMCNSLNRVNQKLVQPLLNKIFEEKNIEKEDISIMQSFVNICKDQKYRTILLEGVMNSDKVNEGGRITNGGLRFVTAALELPAKVLLDGYSFKDFADKFGKNTLDSLVEVYIHNQPSNSSTMITGYNEYFKEYRQGDNYPIKPILYPELQNLCKESREIRKKIEEKKEEIKNIENQGENDTQLTKLENELTKLEEQFRKNFESEFEKFKEEHSKVDERQHSYSLQVGEEYSIEVNNSLNQTSSITLEGIATFYVDLPEFGKPLSLSEEAVDQDTNNVATTDQDTDQIVNQSDKI